MEDCEARGECSVKRKDDILSEQNVSAIEGREWSWEVERKVCDEEQSSLLSRSRLEEGWKSWNE